MLRHRAIRWCSFVLLITILGTILPAAVPLAAQSFIVLFVTGSPTLNAGDSAVQTRLQGLGYTVVVKDHTAATTVDATGKALVLISATVSAGNVGTKFRDVTVPVLLWETALYDDMGMTGPTVGPDYGTSTTTTDIVMSNPAHPLSAGLTGTQTIFPTVQGLSYGTPASTGTIVSLMGTSTTKAVLFAYNTNTTMVSQTAPARRVGFFFNNDSAASMNATGWQLFDAAITWSVGASTPTPTATMSPPTATMSPPTPTSLPSATSTVVGPTVTVTQPTATSTVVGPTATVIQPTATIIQPTATPGPITKSALFVVGSTQLTASDSAVQARLQGLGYTVVVRDQAAAMTADATGKTIILISATVNSGSVNTKFRDVRVPVITWEHGLYDDMKMTGTLLGPDYGNASASQITTQINLADPTQPITAGLTGTQTVFTTAQPLPFGLTATTGHRVALLQGSNTKAVLFAYDLFAPMVGMSAPARRVGFFLSETGATSLTSAGWQLFDAAVGWSVALVDTDGDRIPDHSERAIGTNPTAVDTDGDGLSDGDELLKTFTDPTRFATDTPGISDALADLDGDGLGASLELSINTSPTKADTDGDGLSDSMERGAFNSDPTKADTDADGLTDDSEQRLGTNPRVPDTNGNGIRDGSELFTTSAAMTTGAALVEMHGIGDIAKTVTFQDLTNDTLFQQLPGQLSAAVDIKATVPFTTARVKIRFSPADVPNQDFANLRILYFDEGDRVFKALDADGVDVNAGYAWADTTHFTTFVLFYLPTWQTAWQIPLDGDNNPATPQLVDVMLVLDTSASMIANDPECFTCQAAATFIDALVLDDQVGVVDFDTDAVLLHPLNTNRVAAKATVAAFNYDGGTDIGAGVALTNQQLINHSLPGHLKITILISDGEGAYDPSLTTQANAAGIVIYTIGIGTGVDPTLLQSIAAGTGGTYHPIASAADLPEVLSRLADPITGDGPDTDQDGIPDLIETNGIRAGTGVMIMTDPTKWDTDGDGLSDGQEVGDRQQSAQGQYYEFYADPTLADTDDDDLSDLDEWELQTNIYRRDTDHDGLSDILEITNNFDPLNTNPDGDAWSDLEEWNENLNPFHPDLRGWDYGEAALAGFVYGDTGQWAVSVGLVDEESLHSFAYLGGWFASGVFVLGDIRDTIAAIVRGDIGDALLNALGILPLVGDIAKGSAIITKYTRWIPNIRGPVARWVIDRFGECTDQPCVLFVRAIMKILGVSEDLALLVGKTELDELKAAGNDMERIRELFFRSPNKFHLINGNLTPADLAIIDASVVAKWGRGLDSATFAHARGTETARFYLEGQGYQILYIEGNKAVTQLGGLAPRHIDNGPDIIALSPAGKTVVVEAKGYLSDLSLGNRNIVNNLALAGGLPITQNSFPWLANNSGRYLDGMINADDSKIRQAANLLEDIILRNQTYETIIIAAGNNPKLGAGMDTALEQLDELTSLVEIIKIPWR